MAQGHLPINELIFIGQMSRYDKGQRSSLGLGLGDRVAGLSYAPLSSASLVSHSFNINHAFCSLGGKKTMTSLTWISTWSVEMWIGVDMM